jgi:hypothetical protein
METARHKAPENGNSDIDMYSKEGLAKSEQKNQAFHDLSSHSTMFRQKIIQEFQVLDNVTDIGNVSAPIYTSRDFMGTLNAFGCHFKKKL